MLRGAVTDQDLKEVVQTLLEQAKGGDIASIKELLQSLFGPPVELDFIERTEAMEQKIEEIAKQGARP